ncbi:N-acylneuraminate-9-phosphatase [Camellia lanceoleosa]|uniref:N-acylneuraminate-9-phosphatase n=1 Tax=Camellia lanceoleosa TaxID=1840588 RepID=A0ACC0FRV3_9ERIC|nr:N-acylneuraminate-9-phosphatase [Camellia lanceoleosa]
MALMATTKSKISNLLSILTATHKTPSLASASYSNGAARKFRVAPFGGSGRSLSSSVAPLESDMVSLKDYEKALYGTLVLPSQPMAQIYRQIGEKYGVQCSETEILNRYRRAYEQPWGRSRLRYVNDGRPFWQYIVSSSTGCSDSQYFEELYNYYTTEKAWHLCDPDAEKLQEKPNPTIFIKACELLGVKPEDLCSCGDDRESDIWGARDAGCDAWLWGSDVHSFKEVAQRIGVRV